MSSSSSNTAGQPDRHGQRIRGTRNHAQETIQVDKIFPAMGPEPNHQLNQIPVTVIYIGDNSIHQQRDGCLGRGNPAVKRDRVEMIDSLSTGPRHKRKEREMLLLPFDSLINLEIH